MVIVLVILSYNYIILYMENQWLNKLGLNLKRIFYIIVPKWNCGYIPNFVRF